MSTHDAKVARALKRATDAIPEHPDTPEARARTVAALQAAMAATPEKAAAPRPRWPLALAAGLVALVGVGLWSTTRGPASVARVIASSGALTAGQGLADAAPVDSGEGTLSLALPHDVRLHLQPRTALQLRDAGARVLISRGEVAAEVTTLEQPFVLEAGDTVVATRGARLRLTPGAGCDGRARVEVSEGSALIDATTTVKAGETWPTCAAAALPPPPVEPLPPSTVEPVAAPVAQRPSQPRPPSARAPSASPVVEPGPRPAPPPSKDDDRLARQNELYLEAITLQRAGETNAAVRKLDGILSDATSPLAEAALTQKMKWLTATDRLRARDAAREYLQRFPMGFGRADAETLVLEKP